VTLNVDWVSVRVILFDVQYWIGGRQAQVKSCGVMGRVIVSGYGVVP
jgi:hypothetical protein